LSKETDMSYSVVPVTPETTPADEVPTHPTDTSREPAASLPATGGTPTEPAPADKGCGSTLAAGTLAILLAGGAMLSLRKRKEE
jgi:hypothetical protein